ncbi:MAG TPA: protoglobin domain-containing protein [Ktedonobacterales bacterium]|nr:protoglobin domain-containing protein [Ktedonobacterales bacterium]
MSQGTISEQAASGVGPLPAAPISMEEFQQMKETAQFTHEDVQSLRMSWDVLRDQVDAVLDVWYGFIAAHPFLIQTFSRRSDGQPDQRYLADVRQRFARWIEDTAQANYDQQWLNDQFEIGLRHHRTAKNRTDQVDSVEIVPFRYLVPSIFPFAFTLKPFLAQKGHAPDQVEKMHQAWLKSMLLQVALWSQPYVTPGDF